MEEIQNFSNDSGIPFNQVLELPYWILNEYYTHGAWNIKKEHKENNDLMLKNISVLLSNLNSGMKALNANITAFLNSFKK